MTDVLERFLRYIKIDTQSDDSISDRTPTTEKQWDLARLLEKEMKELGLQDVRLNEQCFLTACLPPNTQKSLPVIGFLAHLDTSHDFCAKTSKPSSSSNTMARISRSRAKPACSSHRGNFPSCSIS